MTQKKGLLIEIGVGIAVIMIATIALGVIYYQDKEEGIAVARAEIHTRILAHDPEQANQVFVFENYEELQNVFLSVNLDPDWINWETHKVVAFVGDTVTTLDFDFNILESYRFGSVVTIKYSINLPDSEPTTPVGWQLVEGYPVVMTALAREDIQHGGQFTYRFQDFTTNETHSLTTFSDEDTTNN